MVEMTRKCLVLLVLCLVTPGSGALAAESFTFHNPVTAWGADPWVIKHDGSYLYMPTTGSNVSLAQAPLLPQIGQVPMQAIWTFPQNTRDIWAPEIHSYDDRWYVYYAARVGTKDHRMYVLESNTSDPFGGYTFRGQITDPTDRWAIDGTVLTVDDKMYFIWSGWQGSQNIQQNLYIAPMSNPWTISGQRVLISIPEHDWERRGGPPFINEGPQILRSRDGGGIHLIYSGSGSWTDDYTLGRLTLVGDPLDPASWQKHSQPIFARTDVVSGPGHASFTTSHDDTRDWIVYHAARHAGAGWDRNVRIQPFSWNADGTPSFGRPVSPHVPIQCGPVSWTGAINGTWDDSVHSYLNPANWVGGAISDSFANVTLTDETVLYFHADHATSGDMVFTHGSGQQRLTLVANSSTARTIALNGDAIVNILGGSNAVNIGTSRGPINLDLGSAVRTFSIAADDRLNVVGGMSGEAGFVQFGGGALHVRGDLNSGGPIVVEEGAFTLGRQGESASASAPALAIAEAVGSAGRLTITGDSSLDLTRSFSSGEVAQGLLIARSGEATVDQVSGSVVTPRIEMALRRRGKAIYNLDGGILTTAGLSRGDGSAEFSFGGGTLRAAADLAPNVAMVLKSGGGTIDTNGFIVTFTEPIAGAGALTKTGAGTMVLSGQNSFAGGTLIQQGALLMAHAEALGSGALFIMEDGQVQITSGLALSVRLSGLDIETGGELELSDNTLILAEADPAAMSELIRTGRVSGSWGESVQSPSEPGNVGMKVVGGEITLMYTWGGDADLSGAVGIEDLGVLAAHWQQSGRYWFQGDFNYDNMVDIADLGILASNWQRGPGDDIISLEQALAMFDAFDGVVVPETAGAWLVVFAGLVARWRRRSCCVLIHREGP
jgi:autotransporter-associated beta strand protein